MWPWEGLWADSLNTTWDKCAVPPQLIKQSENQCIPNWSCDHTKQSLPSLQPEKLYKIECFHLTHSKQKTVEVL